MAFLTTLLAYSVNREYAGPVSGYAPARADARTGTGVVGGLLMAAVAIKTGNLNGNLIASSPALLNIVSQSYAMAHPSATAGYSADGFNVLAGDSASLDTAPTEAAKPVIDGNLIVIKVCTQGQCGYGYGYTENPALSLAEVENVVYDEEVLKLVTLKD